MATMFPSPLPELVAGDPARAAEREVYDALEKLAPEEVRAFHGVSWLARRRDGNAQDGEADFVVLRRDRGILVLEVKGGVIARDGRTGKWTSRDARGGTHDIQDPVAQARRSHYALREKITSLPRWRDERIRIGHAVAFPHCGEPKQPLTPDLPREIVIFADDIKWLAEKLDAVFRYWADQSGGTVDIDPERLRLLEQVLAPSFELRQPLGALLPNEDRQIVRLTEEQVTVLNGLRRNRRVAISGGAGTGKTFLALEKAKRLAAEGYRTLLTCFNRPLAEYLAASASQVEHLTVVNFHWLCDEFAKKAGLVLPTVIDGHYFDDALPAALQRALDRLPAERFDAIVADEGQDFHADWWVLLQLALSHPDDGILYVFHDDNQRIFRREGGLPDGLVPFELSRNLRNTKAIHSVASAFYSGGELVSAGPDGRPVELVEATGPAAVRRQLSRVLHRLITEEKIAPEEIAILSGRTWDNGSLAGENQLGMFPITHDPNGEPGKVLFKTIHSFKGLERPVVVLVDIDSCVEKANAELLYVGLTRARLHLIVAGSKATLAALASRTDALRTRSA